MRSFSNDKIGSCIKRIWNDGDTDYFEVLGEDYSDYRINGVIIREHEFRDTLVLMCDFLRLRMIDFTT
jgi:hypothetical protein